MMSGLSDVLKDFASDVQRVRDLLELIKSFRDFGSSSPPAEIRDKSVVWKEAMVLKEAAPALRTDLPLVSGSMVLYLCGRFEFFVRQIIEVLSDEIARNSTDYEALPTVLRDELKRRTLDVVRAPARYGFSATEADALLVGLAANLRQGDVGRTGPMLIGSKVLSITESNMNSTTLAEVMKRVGMKEIWRDVGKQAKLRAYLHTASDSECATAASRRLDDWMRERNNIAHPTGGTSFPDPNQVLWFVEYLKKLGSVLVELCEVHLTTFVERDPIVVPGMLTNRTQ